VAQSEDPEFKPQYCKKKKKKILGVKVRENDGRGKSN
jgi:hypothetical protein